MTPVWEKVAHLVHLVCLSWLFANFSVSASFSFGLKGRKWDLTALILDYCLSWYFATGVKHLYHSVNDCKPN